MDSLPCVYISILERSSVNASIQHQQQQQQQQKSTKVKETQEWMEERKQTGNFPYASRKRQISESKTVMYKKENYVHTAHIEQKRERQSKKRESMAEQSFEKCLANK